MRLRNANDCGVEEDCTNLERLTRVCASRRMGSATLAMDLSVPEVPDIIKNYLYEILVSCNSSSSQRAARVDGRGFFDEPFSTLATVSTFIWARWANSS